MIVNYTVTRKHRPTCWLAQLMMVHIATRTGVSVFLVFVNQCPNILLQRNVLPQILQVMHGSWTTVVFFKVLSI